MRFTQPPEETAPRTHTAAARRRRTPGARRPWPGQQRRRRQVRRIRRGGQDRQAAVDLQGVRPDDLAAEVIKALIAKTKISPGDVEDLLTAGQLGHRITDVGRAPVAGAAAEGQPAQESGAELS